MLGPSGAGKSTTQNVLIGLIRGWQGRVEVLGRPLRDWGADYYRSIGVTFEAPNHYLKLSARENLEYFRSLYDGQADTVEEVLAPIAASGALFLPEPWQWLAALYPPNSASKVYWVTEAGSAAWPLWVILALGASTIWLLVLGRAFLKAARR